MISTKAPGGTALEQNSATKQRSATGAHRAQKSRKKPLKDRVTTALNSNPQLSRHRLHSETSQGRVVLRGHVGSYYQKQMAQEIVRSVDGVEEIENHLEVHWS